MAIHPTGRAVQIDYSEKTVLLLFIQRLRICFEKNVRTGLGQTYLLQQKVGLTPSLFDNGISPGI